MHAYRHARMHTGPTRDGESNSTEGKRNGTKHNLKKTNVES